jgi:hypothetical protein
MRLPRSGIEIDDARLRIRRPGHPTIELDARLLDAVTVPAPRGARLGGVFAGAAAAVAVVPVALQGGAALLLPAGAAAFAVASGLRWRAARRRGEVELRLGKLRVALEISDGAPAAREAARALARWTRGAPITDPSVYEDAARRLDAALAGRPAPGAERPLRVGDEPVRVEDDQVKIGERCFPVVEVRRRAELGENLALGPGAAVQAALALLVVAAVGRQNEPEDATALRARLAEYERWSRNRL